MHFIAYFQERGVPKTGLTPTITIRRVETGSLEVNAGTMLEVGEGWYRYDFVGYDLTWHYSAIADGGAGLENVDRYVPITNHNDPYDRLTFGLLGMEKVSVTAAVWDEIIRGYHENPESAGELLERPNIKMRCDLPEYADIDALDPNRIGMTSITLIIEDSTGFYDGLKPLYVTNSGNVLVVRVRNGIVTVLSNDLAPTWVSIQNTLRYSKAFNTSEFQNNDMILIVNSLTELTINGRIFRLGEMTKWILIGDNIAKQIEILRLLGLTHENIWVTNTFTGSTHTGSIIEIYDSKTNADIHDGITGLIGKYTLTVNLAGGLPVSHKMVKEP